MVEHSESFWSGPITTERMALRIIKVAGWAFIVAGVVTSFNQAISHIGPAGMSPFLAAVFNFAAVVGPAAFLLSRRNRAPAVVMMLVSGMTAVSLTAVTMLIMTSLPAKMFVLLVAGGWLVLCALAWRSFHAASTLRQLTREPAVDAAEVQAFD